MIVSGREPNPRNDGQVNVPRALNVLKEKYYGDSNVMSSAVVNPSMEDNSVNIVKHFLNLDISGNELNDASLRRESSLHRELANDFAILSQRTSIDRENDVSIIERHIAIQREHESGGSRSSKDAATNDRNSCHLS
jgi:hypothetical protein